MNNLRELRMAKGLTQLELANRVREADPTVDQSSISFLERGGIIRDLRRQVPYVLIKSFRWPSGKACPKTVYKADFVYVIEGTGEVVVEDVKGVLTPEYKLKKKLMMEKFGIEIKEVRV